MMKISVGIGLVSPGGRVAPIPTVVPANTSPPVLTSDILAVDEPYSLSTGAWANKPILSYAYQIQSSPDGLDPWTDIDGATSATGTWPAGVAGLKVRGGSKATNVVGQADDWAYSEAVGPIEGAGDIPGSSPTVSPTTLDIHYHPNTATMANFADATAAVGDRVKSVVDLEGLADLAGAGTSTAPILADDAYGRKYLNFRSGAYAIADALTGMSSQAYTAFLVVRLHKCKTHNFFYPRYQSDGVTANTARLGALTNAIPTGGGVSMLASGSTATFSSADATNRKYALIGSQLQVIVITGRTTAGGGVSYWIDGRKVATGAQQSARTAMIGLILGAAPGSGSVISPILTNGMDLYEFGYLRSGLTDAQAEAISTAALANFSDITPPIAQLFLEGDSITDGVGDIESDQSLGVQLTKPGASLVAAGTRVLNLGTSGNKVDDLVTRRDATISPFGMLLGSSEPLKNRIAVQIGRNEWPTESGAAAYAELVALANSTTTGYLQRGCSVTGVCGIGTSSSLQVACQDQRALMLSSFVTDCAAGSGGAFDGLASTLSLHLAEYGGFTVFEDSTDAADQTYYQDDSTHPNPLGTQIMATGGDTPQNGYGALA